MRVRRETRAPSSDWNDQCIDAKLAAFVSIHCSNSDSNQRSALRPPLRALVSSSPSVSRRRITQRQRRCSAAGRPPGRGTPPAFRKAGDKKTRTLGNCLRRRLRTCGSHGGLRHDGLRRVSNMCDSPVTALTRYLRCMHKQSHGLNGT